MDKKNANNPTIHYLDGIDIVYWINLDRAKDRKKNMEQLFTDPVFQGIETKRIQAYDAKKGNARSKFVLTPDMTSRNNFVTDTEYACLYSNLESIREFSQTTDKKVALILEDDVTLEYKKYWMKSIKTIIQKAPKDWEVIKLCSANQKLTKLYTLWKPWQVKQEMTDCGLTNGWDSNWGLWGYLINHKGANKIIKELYHHPKYVLNNVYRHVADTFLYQLLKTYIYKYPYFTNRHNNNTYIATQIKSSNSNYNLMNKQIRIKILNLKKHEMDTMYKKIFTKKNKTRKHNTIKNKTRKHK